MNTKKFYDIHFHAMDLSHANVTAFVNRLINEDNLLNRELIKELLKKNLGFWKKLLTFIIPFMPYSILSKKIYRAIHLGIKKEGFSKKLNKIRNLLSFMESSIMYDFLIVEYFLKKEKVVSKENQLSIGNKSYNKIVLCPLIMDFGYKNMNNENIFYNIPPQKPITSQIKDVFESINTYYNKEIDIINKNGITKFNISQSTKDKSKKLFEIYPFMGINTQHYDYDEIDGMLNKYFGDFNKNDSSINRQEKLYKKMGEFDGNLENKENCKNIFAGIKLYPPLGFEPWPEDKTEKAKVELLYEICIKRNIPITTHCSTGGFLVDDEFKEFTNPGNQWAKVLKKYPNLKINFAHFGSGSEHWRQTIINHILEENSRVYTDFSCNIENDEYYKKLNKTISDNSTILSDRILFGSDFMINLLWLESYNEYINYFKNTKHLDSEVRFKFSNTNSERFLFG